MCFSIYIYYVFCVGALKKTLPVDGDDEMVNIGGALIKKSFGEYLKNGFSGQPSLFIRHLVFKSGLFTLEEVANSSLTGSKGRHSPAETRKALNPALFRVVKGMYSIVFVLCFCILVSVD